MRFPRLARQLLGALGLAATSRPTEVQSQSATLRSDIVAATELVRELLRSDASSGDALYEAQQRAMSSVEAVFRLGGAAERSTVLLSAAEVSRTLPNLNQLLRGQPVSSFIGVVEGLSPLMTRARQRIGRLAVSVDGVAVPTGDARQCRVFPIRGGDSAITVGSEVQLQFLYLLSTIERFAVSRPLSDADTEALAMLDAFLVNQVRCFWMLLPAWHWSGPFPNVRARLSAKIEDVDSKVREPLWFGAVVDHDLFLLAIAADLLSARRHSSQLSRLTTESDWAMFYEARRMTIDLLRRRIAPEAPRRYFVLDVGRWSLNPSYAYAGCTDNRALPSSPCPVDDVAPDASHARRWPWWLASFRDSWPQRSQPATEYDVLEGRLARQMAEVVLYRTPAGRPILRNYMDGRDGWYRLREFPEHPWGHGPSTMSGALRYGSWSRLGARDVRLKDMQRDFCRIISSSTAGDIAFRTRWYGNASVIPDSGGVGTSDLYGPSSPFALTCRLDAALAYH